MAIDVQQLKNAGTYQTEGPLSSILDDIEQIGDFLKQIEIKRGNFRKFGYISLGTGLVLAVLGGITHLRVLSALAFLEFAAGVGLYIYSFVYGRSMHTHHSRYDLLKGLFKVLQRDAHPRSPFSVKLALKSQPAKLREEPWTVRKNGKQQFFEEDYLSIEGELLDGTVLSGDLTELTRKRTFTNPRGKSKTKTRTRYILALKFRYPSDLYADARPAQQALQEAIRVPPSANIRETRVDEKAITVKSMVTEEPEIVDTTAMICLGAYRTLNLARRMRVAGGTK